VLTSSSGPNGLYRKPSKAALCLRSLLASRASAESSTWAVNIITAIGRSRSCSQAYRSRRGRNPFGRLPHEGDTRPGSLPRGSLFIPGHRVRFIALTVLTLKATVACDFHGGTKGLSDEMARRPMIGRIPVHRLMLDLL
jgi:hypothetical protein